MSKNVFLETSNLKPADQKLFAQWLAQYEAENDLNQVFESNPDIFADCEGPEDSGKLAAAAVPDMTPPAPGQIRMLKASLTSDPEIVTPVLILSQWEGSQWLIAPFSRFNVPATPGEMSSDEDFSAYKVLEVWNAAVVPEFLLCSKTVFLRTVPESFRQEACQLYFHLLADDELTDSAVKRIGPPIQSQIDPRIQYLLDEKEQLRPLQAEAERINSLLAVFSVPSQHDPLPMVISMAAGEAEKESAFYTVENSLAVVRCLIRDGQFKIKVFSADRMNYSRELDGWMVLLGNGKVLGSISDTRGHFPVSSQFDGQAVILTAPDGSIHKLSPMK